MPSSPSLRSERLVELITPNRLSSYLRVMGSRDGALRLYDWNIEACAAVLATTAVVEVVIRNAIDSALQQWAHNHGKADWLTELPLDERGRTDVARAIERARARSGMNWRGQVIAELNFGFWRYLVTSRYLTSLWIPALQHAFPAGIPDPLARQKQLDQQLQQLVFVRNRAAHHEPLHERNLLADLQAAEVSAGAVDSVAAEWLLLRSAIPGIVAAKPSR